MDDGDDDLRTRLQPPHADGALPVGHRLQEFVLDGVLGEGGFSIVYRARDLQLGRTIAIKEYLPQSLAGRNADLTVSARSKRHQETFDLGLRSFVNEARLLASFDHPALVKVYRFWEENGTAYMVMPLYHGPTLKSWLSQHGSPSEAWLRAMLAPLLDALDRIHRDHCFHRDIAADNILLLDAVESPAGANDMPRPLLLDFGAARRVIGDANQTLTVILKPGYAPIEQYAESTEWRQGPWTDIYALCALLYSAVTGRVPAPAVNRIIRDEMISASQAGGERYSQDFLRAIDAGLAVRPEQRPQSVAAFQRMLQLRGAASVPPLNVSGSDGHATVLLPSIRPSDDEFRLPAAPEPMPSGILAAESTTAGTLAKGLSPPSLPAHDVPKSESIHSGQTLRPRSGATIVAAITLTVSAAALLMAWLGWGSSSNPEVAVSANAPALSASEAWSGSAPPASGNRSNHDAVPTEGAPRNPNIASTNPGATPPVDSPGSSAASFTVSNALRDMVDGGDAGWTIDVGAERSTLVIARDHLKFHVQSPRDGYLYIFTGGTDNAQLSRLFPNANDSKNRILANQIMRLPRPRWPLVAGGPPGTNALVIVVSEHPLDVAATGLRIQGKTFPEFHAATAMALWTQRRERRSPFLGTAKCKDASECSDRYAAHLLEIIEVSKP